MFKQIHVFSLLIVSCLIFIASQWVKNATASQPSSPVAIPIGAVLDLDSPLGSMTELCMEMAIADFYAAHPNYATRLQLHVRNATSVLDANLAALDLLDNEEVQGIVKSIGETMFAELGQKFKVPIISLVSGNSLISSTENRYFVRITPDDAIQAQALVAIFQTFQWLEIAMLYEDIDDGHRFLSYMMKAIQDTEIKLANAISIPSLANDSSILEELNKLSTKQTRIFLVHMTPSLGFRFFNLAESVGIMSEGDAWLITDSLSAFMKSMDLVTHGSMEGVIGIRPFVKPSQGLESFQERFKRNVILKSTTSAVMELNYHGLWAYDTVTALAIAAEKMIVSHVNMTKDARINDNISLSHTKFGTSLLNELLNINFLGFSGHFKLVDGKRKPTGFEIFNVFISGEKIIGFWMPHRGIVKEWNSTYEMKGLKTAIWPGDSTKQPRGWNIPRNLKVGILRRQGFNEFGGMIYDPSTKQYQATGYTIDIFMATLNLLPFPVNYTFHSIDLANIKWNHNAPIQKMAQELDMIAADVTIWAERAKNVDFSTPFSESRIVLVLKNKKSFDMWIFMKPFKWDLWIAIISTCILMGIVLRFIEHHGATDAMDTTRRRAQQPAMVYWSPVVILAFPERSMVSNKWSFLVLVFWIFMAFILMQSYTANLSAILTVDQLYFAFSDNYYVGYQEGSFMKVFLTKQIHINESRLRSYTSAEEFHQAMCLGSKRGGIDAIFDELPYMEVFLNKYDSQYKIVGPTYRTGGLGFVFHLNSPLVAHFSRAILEITQGPNMTAIEQKNFGPGYSSQDPLPSTISQQTSSLTIYEFAGLFIIIASVIVVALFCSKTPIGRSSTRKAEHFLHSFFNMFKRSHDESSVTDARDNRDVPEVDREDSHECTPNKDIISLARDDEDFEIVEEISRHGEDEAHVTQPNTETFDSTCRRNS